jgi:hypothetical protein
VWPVEETLERRNREFGGTEEDEAELADGQGGSLSGGLSAGMAGLPARPAEGWPLVLT